jgi:hypothetical protein
LVSVEKTLREREYLVGWSIILKWLIKTWDGGVDWIDPTQDRDKFTGFFENGNDTCVSLKFEKFLDYVRIC